MLQTTSVSQQEMVEIIEDQFEHHIASWIRSVKGAIPGGDDTDFAKAKVYLKRKLTFKDGRVGLNLARLQKLINKLAKGSFKCGQEPAQPAVVIANESPSASPFSQLNEKLQSIETDLNQIPQLFMHYHSTQGSAREMIKVGLKAKLQLLESQIQELKKDFSNKKQRLSSSEIVFLDYKIEEILQRMEVAKRRCNRSLN